MNTGHLWVVDAFECDPGRLRSREVLDGILRAVVVDLGLCPVAPARWHVFPEPGGLTGYLLLSESHLAVHTYPESGFAAFDLYCCRDRADWPWRERLTEALDAREVVVTGVARGISRAVVR